MLEHAQLVVGVVALGALLLLELLHRAAHLLEGRGRVRAKDRVRVRAKDRVRVRVRARAWVRVRARVRVRVS